MTTTTPNLLNGWILKKFVNTNPDLMEKEAVEWIKKNRGTVVEMEFTCPIWPDQNGNWITEIRYMVEPTPAIA